MPALSTYMIDAAATNLHFTPAKAIQQIGYKQQVSYNEGIARTVDWYLKNMVSGTI